MRGVCGVGVHVCTNRYYICIYPDERLQKKKRFLFIRCQHGTARADGKQISPDISTCKNICLLPNHYLRFAANTASREARHVTSFSRPSDRPSGRPRSCFPQPFCKKALELKRNQPAVQIPLLENFAKKPSAFLKINPQSHSAG